jgi:hypothetical protein
LLGQFDRFTVNFDEPIQDGTFTVGDVSLTGPGGAITPTAVNKLGASVYEVVFALQTAPGNYSLTVGPNVLDLNGYAMDQNANGTPGETQDSFTSAVELATSLSFDFGTSSSPVAAGARQVTPTTSYSAALGYGWLGSPVQAVDRGTSDALHRDLAYGSQLTFGVNAMQGNYNVTLIIGDTGPYAHDFMAVFLEGMQVDVVNTAAGQIRTITYNNVPVNDGQLTLLLVDQGGSDPNVVLNGLGVVRSGSGQSIQSISRSETSNPAVSLPAFPPDFVPHSLVWNDVPAPLHGRSDLPPAKSEKRSATGVLTSLFVYRPALNRDVLERVFAEFGASIKGDVD